MAACGREPERDASPRNSDHLDDTVRISRTQVGIIELKAVDSVKLQENDAAGAPLTLDITDLVSRDGRWYVLDYTTKRAVVFDSTGNLAGVIGTSGDSARIVSPRRIAFIRDTMLIVDLGSDRHIRAFTLDGREAALARVPNGGEASDIAVTSMAIGVAMRATAPVALRNRATFASLQRDSVASACPADRRYREALKDGTLSSYVFTTLGVGYAGKVACVQPISPVVAVFDPRDHTTAFMTRIPPDYKAPKDVPMNMNAKAMAAYRASWTQHQIAYPTKAGVFSIFELPRDSLGRTFLLFACDSSSGLVRCAENRVRGKSVRFVDPDTVLIARGGEGVSLLRFIVTRWY